MGWVDNLDEELAENATTQTKCTDENKPSTSKVEIIRQSKEDEDVQLKSTAKSDDDAEKTKDKLAKAVELFAHRVTVAGVEDTYKATIPAEKLMWYVCMICAIGGTIYTSANAATKYLYSRKIYDHFPIAAYHPPFPNVSICAPLSLNKTAFQELLVISNRTINFMKVHNLDLNKLFEFNFEFWRMDDDPRVGLNKLMLHASLQLLKDSSARLPNGIIDFLTTTSATCIQTLSNCSFYGIAFDCCRWTDYLFVFDHWCFYIDMNRVLSFHNMTPGKTGTPDDPIKMENSGLVFNVSFDWAMASYYESIAEDGFLLDVGRTIYTSSSPTALPAGADAVITLSATKQKEITNCVANNRIAKMKYFDYYDSMGLFSYIENTKYHEYFDQAGCYIPILTFFPKQNSSVPICPPDLLAYVKTFSQTNEEFSTLDKKGCF